MMPVKISNKDKKYLQQFITKEEETPVGIPTWMHQEEKMFIRKNKKFLKMCEKDSYIEEDMPQITSCVKGSKKVSEEQFYSLHF